MLRLPENYESLVTPNDGGSAQPHLISFYTKSIHDNLKKKHEIPGVYISMMNTLDSLNDSSKMDNGSLDYLVELLARLNRHLDPETSLEDQLQNTVQLQLLLEDNSHDIINIILYSLAIAALASVALLAVTGAVALTMPGLFLATAGVYLAAFAALAGAAYGIQQCTTEIAFSAKSYSLRSDANTLMSMSVFANPSSVQTNIDQAGNELRYA